LAENWHTGYSTMVLAAWRTFTHFHFLSPFVFQSEACMGQTDEQTKSKTRN